MKKYNIIIEGQGTQDDIIKLLDLIKKAIKDRETALTLGATNLQDLDGCEFVDCQFRLLIDVAK